MIFRKLTVLLSLLPGYLGLFAQSNAQLDMLKDFSKRVTPHGYDSNLRYTNLLPGGKLQYLFPLYQLFRQEAEFKNRLGFQSYNLEMSKSASFLEDYQNALDYQTRNYDSLDPATERDLKKAIGEIKGIVHADAAKYIGFAALKYRVIMINESYNKPLHRAFIISCLDELYRRGFRYFAWETFSGNAKASLNKLNINTGYFTMEPVGGELVRIALEKGFKLVPFSDTTGNQTPALRDSIQASRLYSVLKKDSGARILVLAAYEHIAKRSDGPHFSSVSIAFKKISGINPLCIDQVSLCDESEFSYGKAFYELYTARFPVQFPSIPLLDNQAVNITNNTGYDLCIVHPHTQFRDNRPGWLSLNGLRKAVYVKATVPGTFLVQAYYEEETRSCGPGQLVPADQTYLSTNHDSYLLYLRKGKYLVTMRSIGYHLIGRLNLEVN
jgi:hypothetical protein